MGYEVGSRSNANSCVISLTIAIFQDSLHQNYDALSIFPDPITILTESHSNPRCLATTEFKITILATVKMDCNAVNMQSIITSIIFYSKVQ